MLKIKRAYEPEERGDGYRVLIDRLWPRGVKKTELRLNAWWKELAPSNELRKRFGHDPDRWKEFQSEYRKELRGSKEARDKIRSLAALAKKKHVTLIYSAKDEEHNDAVVLKRTIERSSSR